MSFCFYSLIGSFRFVIKTTEKPQDDMMTTEPANDVPAEKSDDLGGVDQSQCDTETIEEVNRYYTLT